VLLSFLQVMGDAMDDVLEGEDEEEETEELVSQVLDEIGVDLDSQVSHGFFHQTGLFTALALFLAFLLPSPLHLLITLCTIPFFCASSSISTFTLKAQLLLVVHRSDGLVLWECSVTCLRFFFCTNNLRGIDSCVHLRNVVLVYSRVGSIFYYCLLQRY
jgi:hypothetical protein